MPAIFSMALGNRFINDLNTDHKNKTIQTLDEKSDLLIGSFDYGAFFLCLFQETAAEIQALDKIVINEVDQIFARKMGRFTQITELYVIDPDFTQSISKYSQESRQDLFTFLWRYSLGIENEQEYAKFRTLLSQWYGRSFHPRILKAHNNMSHPVTFMGKPGTIFYSNDPESRRGVFILMEQYPELAEFADAIFNKHSDGHFNYVITNEESEKLVAHNFDGNRSALVSSGSSAADKYFYSGGSLWKQTKIGANTLYIGCGFAPDSYNRFKLPGIVLLLFVMFYGLYILASGTFSSTPYRLSIRLKLVAVFIFAVYLPVTGLLFLSYSGLADRKLVLENDAWKGMQDILFQIDSDFSIKEDEILATFENFYNNQQWISKLTDDRHANDRVVREAVGIGLTGPNFFNWLEVRDINLNQIYTSNFGERNVRIRDMGRAMAQICLEKFMPQEIHKAGIRNSPSDLILKNLMENPVIGFTYVFEVPGKLVPMDFEGNNTYWYWNYYKDHNGGIAYLAANTRAQYNSAEYLSDRLTKRVTLGNTQLTMIALYPQEHLWFPDAQPPQENIKNLFRIARLEEKLVKTKISHNGERFLALCFPGINIKDSFLACLYPERTINDQITDLRHKIMIGVFLILLIAIFTGLLLSRTFLKPVAELDRGMQALQNRNTDFRVDIRSSDEFGDLGKTFNQMMEEVKEMLLAAAVQQCLIPAAPPEIPGFELSLYNRMATDVGGDYADVLKLPDDRFLIVLGDVTGHGISSSLLTAMVKALVFRFSHKPSDVGELLKNLSHMVLDLLKRRKLMTFCAIILEQATGKYLLANAGHPYPIVCPAEGKPHFIEHSSLPLGVSKKRSVYPVIEGKFNQGDVVMIYTDGIAEAENPEGIAFGFDRIESLIGHNRHKSAKEIEQEVLKAFSSHYQQENLDDDLTFIVFKRLIADDSNA